MKTFSRNIVLLGRVFVIIFLLANSGFTMVLHFCTMSPVECCESSAECGEDCCGMQSTATPLTGTVILDGDQCRVDAVAGGLSTLQAMLERRTGAETLSSICVLPPTFSPAASADWTTRSLHIVAWNIPPPSVEKYVRHEALLI